MNEWINEYKEERDFAETQGDNVPWTKVYCIKKFSTSKYKNKCKHQNINISASMGPKIKFKEILIFFKKEMINLADSGEEIER